MKLKVFCFYARRHQVWFFFVFFFWNDFFKHMNWVNQREIIIKTTTTTTTSNMSLIELFFFCLFVCLDRKTFFSFEINCFKHMDFSFFVLNNNNNNNNHHYQHHFWFTHSFINYIKMVMVTYKWWKKWNNKKKFFFSNFQPNKQTNKHLTSISIWMTMTEFFLFHIFSPRSLIIVLYPVANNIDIYSWSSNQSCKSSSSSSSLCLISIAG